MSTTEPGEKQLPQPVEAPAVPARAARPPLERVGDGRVVGGVAAGLARHLGLPVGWIRLAFVGLTIPFGAGIAVYAFLWVNMAGRHATPDAAVAGSAPQGPVGAAAGTPAASSRTTHATIASTSRRRELRAWLRNESQPVIIGLLGLGALAVAGALWLSGSGFDLHPEVVLPIVTLVTGTVFFWSQLDETFTGGTTKPVRWMWLLVGLGLSVLGIIGLAIRGTSISQIWQVAGAVLAALVGVLVLAAPWGMRLWANLREEQTARIRATERADIAAHLHDSVLQTLALIQRRPDDAVAVARLARAQERQLRSYLYGSGDQSGSLGDAVTAAIDEIEDLHGVAVEVVVTGDRPMSEHLDAFVKATREAVWNAVRHGEPPVTVYVEVGPKVVEAFVRDHGKGFDLDDVPDDRAGVRESIIGRMERHGGAAKIRRRSDGTEVELSMPLPTEENDAEEPAPAGSPTESSPQSPTEKATS